MKKTGLNRYLYEFSVGYRNFNPTNIDKTMEIIHEYFMVKYGIL